LRASETTVARRAHALARRSGFRGHAGTLIILLVESDPHEAKRIARLLAGSDDTTRRVKTHVASSVAAARECIDDLEQPPGGVLADIAVGGVDVLEHALFMRPTSCAMAIAGQDRSKKLDDDLARLHLPVARKPVDALVMAAFARRVVARSGEERAKRRAIVETLGTAIGLTPAERETCFHLSYGMSAMDIGEAMGIAEATVRSHLEEVRRKLGLRSTPAVLGRIIMEIFRSQQV
jgi:DNA-binding CsgD family transcriptional regulator